EDCQSIYDQWKDGADGRFDLCEAQCDEGYRDCMKAADCPSTPILWRRTRGCRLQHIICKTVTGPCYGLCWKVWVTEELVASFSLDSCQSNCPHKSAQSFNDKCPPGWSYVSRCKEY